MSGSKLEFEQSLIAAVKDRPILYDLALDDYKDRDKKMKVWVQIGVILEKSGKDCEDEWKKIRGQFTGWLRKVKGKTGSGKSKVARFRHADAMQFYKEHYHPHTTSVTNLTDSAVDEEGEVEDSQAPEYAPHDQIVKSVELKSVKPEIPTSSKKAFGKRYKEMDPFEVKFLEEYANKSKMDEFDSFCSSLAPKLRRINENHTGKAMLLQVKIL